MDDISYIRIPLVKDTFGYEQKDQVYYDNGLTSGSFIVNQFGLIRIFILVIFIHLWWLISVKVIFWTSQKIINLKQKVFNFFHFQTYIRLILEAFLFNFIAAFTEAVRIRDALSSSIPISSYLFGWVFTLLLVVFIVFIVAYYWRKREKVWESEYFTELFEPFKNTHLAKQYYAVFTIRRLLIVFIVVLCKDLSNNYKLFIYILLQFIAFVYTIFVIPFVSKLDCVVEITNESFYITICVLIVANNITANYTNILNVVILTLVILNGIVVWIEINSVSIYYLVKKCINCKKKITPVVQIKVKHEPKVIIIDFAEAKNIPMRVRRLESTTSIPTVQNTPNHSFYRVRKDIK